MSLKVILRNIYSFLEVLESGLTESVQSWDLQAFHNAFSWAQYVEQIYRQTEGKPYQEELRSHVAELGHVKLWRLGDLVVSLDLLRDASRILQEALLQNPCVPDQLWQALVSRSTENTQKKEAFISGCLSLCQQRSTLAGLAAIQAQMLRCVGRPAGVASGAEEPRAGGVEACRTRADARLLVEFVLRVLSRCRTEEEAKQMCQNLEGVILEISKDNQGWETLLTGLILVETEPCPTTSELVADTSQGNQLEHRGIRTQQLLLDTVLSSARQDTSIWSDASVELLTRMASCYSSFFDAYTAFLTELGNSLVKVDGGWRSTRSEYSSLPHDRFLEQWCHLCRNERTRERTVDLLHSAVECSRTSDPDGDSTVWRGVCLAVDSGHLDSGQPDSGHLDNG